MMVNRSEVKEKLNKTIFFSETEARDAQSKLGNVISKIDQIMIVLDDMQEQEQTERIEEVEKLLSEKDNQNPVFKEWFRDIFYTQKDAWEVVFVSNKTPEEFYYNAKNVLVYDDEVNGYTPVSPIKKSKINPEAEKFEAKNQNLVTDLSENIKEFVFEGNSVIANFYNEKDAAEYAKEFFGGRNIGIGWMACTIGFADFQYEPGSKQVIGTSTYHPANRIKEMFVTGEL